MDPDSVYAYLVRVVEEDAEYERFMRMLSKHYRAHKRDIDEFLELMKEFQEEYKSYDERQKAVLATAVRYLFSLVRE